MAKNYQVIYLDQNKWIDLSKAFYNRRGGERFKPVLERLQSLVNSGKIVLPLSSVHLIETRKDTNIERRTRLVRVMVELSMGWTLAPTYFLTPKEIDAAFDTLFNEKEKAKWPNALGRGIIFAFGRSEHLHIDLFRLT